MTEYTEGPWSVADYDQGDKDDVWRTVMARGRIVANVNPESFCDVEGWFVDMPVDANARLIAAAPDLLEALQEMVRTFAKKHAPAVDVARTAIARATGEQP